HVGARLDDPADELVAEVHPGGALDAGVQVQIGPADGGVGDLDDDALGVGQRGVVDRLDGDVARSVENCRSHQMPCFLARTTSVDGTHRIVSLHMVVRAASRSGWGSSSVSTRKLVRASPTN